MVFTQPPVVSIMGKGGFFGIAVTEIAVIPIVATRAHGVYLLGLASGCLGVGGTMAVVTPLALMAIGTVQTKPVGMVGMIESDRVPLLNRNTVRLFPRLSGSQLGGAAVTGRVKRCRLVRLVIKVALDAFGRTAPCLVTTETLAVIDPFEARLAQRLRF